MTSLDRDTFIKEYVALGDRIDALSRAMCEKRFEPSTTKLKVSSTTLENLFDQAIYVREILEQFASEEGIDLMKYQ